MAVMSLADGIDRLQQRAAIVKALLIAGLVLTAAVLVGEYGELSGSIALGNPYPSQMEQLYTWLLLAHSAVAIITIVAFSMWIYRAAANVVAAEVPGFDFTPGWAVGWYFIPFANLYQPFVAMRQIWNASLGEHPDDLDHGHPILTLWWTTWLLSNISANISMQIGWRATTTEMLETSLYFGIASSVISLILLPVGIRLVDRISTAQRDRLTMAHVFA